MRRFQLITALLCAAAILGAALLLAVLSRGGTVRPAGGSIDAGPVSPAVAVSQRVGAVTADQPLTVHVLLPVNGDLPKAERYLHDAGLAVTDLPLSGLLTAIGPARAVDSAFRVRLYRWHSPTTGENFYANDTPATLPFAVDGVFGLDDAFRLRPLDTCQGSFGPIPMPTGCGSGLKAEQLRKAYNVQSLSDAGTKGDGQTVAIYAESGYSQQYIDDFDAHNNLIAPTINVTRVIQGSLPTTTLTAGTALPPTGGPAELELELDIEAVHAIADHAAIHVYEMDPGSTKVSSPAYFLSTGYVDFLWAVAYFHEHIASISAGNCEADLGGQAATQYATLTQALVDQEHISVLAASGDTGRICPSNLPTPKNNFQNYEIGVNYPASDPSVTAVGGTNLKLNSDDTLNTEEAWDQHSVSWPEVSGGEPEASGGGPAAVPSYKLAFVRVMTSFPRPNWQTGVPTGTQRLVPDVAAMSVPGLTIAVNPKANNNSEWRAGSGTSLSAPLWAGFAALYNQDAQAQGAPLLGFANPLLYRLAGQPDHALFDVTTDQLPGDDLAGHAHTGWDYATGVGSFNAYTIIHDGIALTLRLDIRKVNWAEITLPAGTCGSSAPVRVHGGIATNISPPGGYRGFATVAVEGPGAFGTVPDGDLAYGDLAGDGRTEAAVHVGCDTGGFVADSGLGDSILVYGVDPENQLLLLGVLPSTHVSFGASGATGRLGNIQVVRGAVTADESYYNSINDSGCCPSGLAHHIWPWKADGGFVPSLTPAG